MLTCGFPGHLEDDLVPHRRDVVVIDGFPETEEVLRAVFEPRGLSVVSIPSSAASWPGAVEESSVLVVCGDESAGETLQMADRFAVPRVFIGRITVTETPTGDRIRCLPQPFQYADLIAAIEELAELSRS